MAEEYPPTPPIDEIDRLKKQIMELEEEEDVYENDYEELLATNHEMIHRTISDMIATTQLDIRSIPAPKLAPLLKYFKGSTVTVKKAKLIKFLNLFPCFKSQNINLIKRRFKRFKKAAKAYAEADQLNTPFWQEVENAGFLID